MKKVSVLLLILALVVVGCAAPAPTAAPAAAPAADEAAAPAAPAAEKVSITIESWRNDDLAIWQDIIIPAFNQGYPDIEVIFASVRPRRVQRRPQRQAARRHRR